MTFRFDRFTLDGDTRRLLLGSEEVHLSPKALHLLLVLVENRHRAVSRADLQKELWPSTYVLDTNLASLIKEIRRALGDTADTPKFVRTVHRFGYWFIGELRDGASPQSGNVTTRYWLIWAARQIPVTEGTHVLGRAPDASVWIDAPGISRHHARLVLEGEQAMLEDLGSKNGTYVGEERVTAPRRLDDGDQIRLGPVVITFRIPPAVGATDTVRSV
ncbi:MAG TPA: FHA domain-containing protein [Vicinamibacterales bacterium]|nr:FHA domain-containing protein [Vicinamibacterales bacterium]